MGEGMDEFLEVRWGLRSGSDQEPSAINSTVTQQAQRDTLTMTNTSDNSTSDNSTSDNSACVNIPASRISDLLMGIYILAFVLGLIFNLLTLGPILRQVCSHNVLGVYLLNLSVSDLLYIFTMPLWIYYYRTDHQWKLGLEACKAAGFFYYSNMYVSIYLLCCISVDRCLAITYPLKAKVFRRSRYAWAICFLVAAVVMALHILVLVMEGEPLDGDKRCYESYPLTSTVALFNVIRVCLGFVGPLLVLGFCYAQIFSKVRRSCGVDEQVKRKVKLLSIGVMVIFAVCFAPYHILLLVRSLVFFWTEKQKNCAFEGQVHFYFSCTLAMSSLNSVVDPLLYVLSSNGVKEEIRHCCWLDRNTRLKPTGTRHLYQQKQVCLTSLT
ncbi:hypothetical protein SKAU_G00090540 [Synaphobranchus kaupii]|uniref:G-protein coupled receptors family 1 profile domain-containing protein n=1 Tax=Synaphobranchus kaupii TaxID=118154 RepID=A0A9Q1FWK9_SYNKA|nr:hypothetical protein SKAU_G00090540 [Synaphobranchus kaupii]